MQLEVQVVNGALVPSDDMAKELEKLREFQVTLQEMKNEEALIKNAINEAFEKAGIEKHSIDLAGAKFTYKNPSVRTSVDTKKLKSEMPEIYDAFKKETPVNGSWSVDYGE